MVLIPFISNPKTQQSLERRKGGGGGGGRGGGGGSGGRGSNGGSGSGSSGGVGGTGGSTSNTGSNGNGGSFSPPPPANRGTSTVSTIGSSQLFSGRTQGGGTRDQIYGTKQYGSGYGPGVSGKGVSGRGFPFFYWPIAWVGVGAGTGAGAYLYTHEYGLPDNSSRPGGSLRTASFLSISNTTTYRLLSDESTLNVLIPTIISTCGTQITNASSISSIAYSNNSGPPFPEQAVQYYRASSVALTLDGYNNTAVFDDNENTPDVPLPNNIDTNLLDCLNITIGNQVPLVGSASTSFRLELPSSSSLGLITLAWMLSRLVLM